MSCCSGECDDLGVAVGPAGRDGASLIINDTIVASTGADVLLTTLKTLTIPANTLKTDGDKIVIEASLVFANNVNAKTVTLALPNQNVVILGTKFAYKLITEMNRINATNYMTISVRFVGDGETVAITVRKIDVVYYAI